MLSPHARDTARAPTLPRRPWGAQRAAFPPSSAEGAGLQPAGEGIAAKRGWEARLCW